MPTDRVVIIGASTTGLFAAAAVAGPGRTVTVLERDDLPSGPVPRPGVPQGRQPPASCTAACWPPSNCFPDSAMTWSTSAPFPSTPPTSRGSASRAGPVAPAGPSRYVVRQPTIAGNNATSQGCRARRSAGRQRSPRLGLDAVGARWTVRTGDGGDVDADLVIDARVGY